MKNKIAIASCYFKNNYGSQLQAFATQKIIENMGFETQTINLEENIDFKNGKKKYYISQLKNISFIKEKFGMIKLKIDKKFNKNLQQNLSIRDQKFEEFKKVYHLTKAYKNYQELTEMSKTYDAVVVGSDQLWLPVNVVADYYTLNFVPDEVNKISYSTSFGISQIPDEYKELYEKFLNRIDFLSVREDKGKEMIQSLINKEAKVVCDPTFLLDKEEWMCIQQEERIIKEPYILCYFLGDNIEHRKFAEKLKEKTGYKIVSLNHCDQYVKYSDKFADETPYDIGPGEFVNLIRNAEYICTDSFHGTVFSIINEKNFYTFRRFKNNSKMSTNSRIDSLLNKLELQNRLLNGDEDIEETINESMDYDKVIKEVEKFRNESKEFLMKALKNMK